MEIVLASLSPRRRELITLLRVPFRVRAARHVDEAAFDGPPRDRVMALAHAKAREVAAAEAAGAVVLGADTVIAHGGDVLGKPRDAGDALDMLKRLSGETHEVFTGVTVIAPDGTARTDVAVSRVTFHRLAADTIERYVASGEPLGKAGSYAIQANGARLVAGLHGCYYNVVGLPLRLAARLLKSAGVDCDDYRCDCSDHPLQRATPDCAQDHVTRAVRSR